MRQNLDNSPLRSSCIALTILCAPRIVQLIPRFFIRFAVVLSPLDSMVPRDRASAGALGALTRQSTPTTTFDSTYFLYLSSVSVSHCWAADISAWANETCPERIASYIAGPSSAPYHREHARDRWKRSNWNTAPPTAPTPLRIQFAPSPPTTNNFTLPRS